MSTSERIETMQIKHSELDKEIEDEAGRPLPDNVHLHELKRQKLALKDAMNALDGA